MLLLLWLFFSCSLVSLISPVWFHFTLISRLCPFLSTNWANKSKQARKQINKQQHNEKRNKSKHRLLLSSIHIPSTEHFPGEKKKVKEKIRKSKFLFIYKFALVQQAYMHSTHKNTASKKKTIVHKILCETISMFNSFHSACLPFERLSEENARATSIAPLFFLASHFAANRNWYKVKMWILLSKKWTKKILYLSNQAIWNFSKL